MAQKSQTLATTLAVAGVQSGGVVALLLQRSPLLVLAQVATLRLGASYSPLDTLSPPAQLRAALDMLQPSVIITDGSREPPSLPHCRVVDLRSCDLDHPDGVADSWSDCANESVAYVTFTSGTTGVPKGVMIPHSGISRLVCDPDWATFTSNSRFGFISSPAFDASTLEVWAPLLNGGCCVLQDKPAPSLDDIANFIQQNTISDVFLTSALFCAMVDHRLDCFGELRQLITGGERVSPHHARIFLQTYPSVRLINGYGPTENTTFTTCQTITVADTDNPAGIPIGSAIRGTRIRIGSEPEEADNGELLACGYGIAIGYLNDNALTAEKFVTVAGARWYKTGDLVHRRADGLLEFEGRLDRQVKLQGHRIELDAIETLLSSIDGIGQCTVFVSGSSAMNRHLVAFYTLLNGTRPTSSEILAFLQMRLPLHAIPRVLRVIGAMPRNASGKIDHHRLQLMHSAAGACTDAACTGAAHPAAAYPGDTLPSAANAPYSDTEVRLGQLWSQLFPSLPFHPLLSLDSVGATSLQALQLSAAIRREFQKFLSAIQLIRTPVLRDQAALIEQLPFNTPDTTRCTDSTEPHELTQIQHSVLAADALDESGCAFLVHVALRFETPAILSRVRQVFEQLAQRHPALRLSIADVPGTYYASVDRTLGEGWYRHHGPLNPEPDVDAVSPEILHVINRPLHYANDGVMRVDSWGQGDGPTLIVWTIHHVAIDEASIDLCLSDIDALLNARELPPVIGNALDLAAFERKRTAVSAQHYWSSRILDSLGDKAPALPRAPGYGCEVDVDFPVRLSRTVLAWCGTASVTPFAPLLVAYGRAVQSVFGNEYALVATPFTRRSDPAIGDVVGCVIDLNLIEAGALPNETLTENLLRVYATTSELQECAFFPFERVSEEISRQKPGAERHLNGFAFTWRLAPARNITLGEMSARLLRIPQQGARFGMTLHAWMDDGQLRCSIETLDDVTSRDNAREVGRHLVTQLLQVCHAGFAPLLHQTSVPSSADYPYSAKLLDTLKRCWILNTGMPVTAFTDDANFWELGGNSLTALQMLAQLAREPGVQIDPAFFFALPTFANLHRLAALTSARSDAIHDVIGVADAERLVVLFPGDNGSTLGVHALGQHLQRLLGDTYAVIIIDLEEVLRRAPKGQFTTFVNNRCLQLLDVLGRDRVTSLIGFSSGGLTALALAHTLKSTPTLSVWLLDTYKPYGKIALWTNRTLRPAVRKLLRSPLLAKLARTHVRSADTVKLPEPPPGSIEHVRQQAREDLLKAQPAPPTGRAHLVQATKTVRDVFLLHNRQTNGFDDAYFKHGSILRMDCLHQEIPSERAEQVAVHIAATIQSQQAGPRK